MTRFKNKIKILDHRNVLFISDFLWLVMQAEKVASSVYRCYHAVKVTSIFTIKTAFNSIHNDVLPILKQSLLIYEFNCRCISAYIVRTCQRLEVRIRQHVHRGILDKGRLTSGESLAKNLAIGEHLLAINSYRTNYQNDCFSVLHRVRDKVQLNILKAIYMAIDRPSLCRPRSSHILNILGDALCYIVISSITTRTIIRQTHDDKDAVINDAHRKTLFVRFRKGLLKVCVWDTQLSSVQFVGLILPSTPTWGYGHASTTLHHLPISSDRDVSLPLPLEWPVWSSSSRNNCHAVQRSLSSGASVHESIMGFFFTSSDFICQFPPTRFPLITAIRMCHFLLVHHLEWHFWRGQQVKT